MPIYRAPVQDVRFVLNDVLHMNNYANLPGFADASPDLVDAILGEAAKMMEEVIQPLNQAGDLEGCKFENGKVTSKDRSPYY